MKKNASELRGALVGYGFIGAYGHSPFYRKEGSGVSLQAVCDVTEARLVQARKDFGNSIRCYQEFSLFLEKEAPHLDFIDIAVPPKFHASMATQALKKGLHVLCEKPVTISLKQIQAIKALAQEQKRVFFPCHTYRYAPVVQKINAVLSKNALGSVRFVALHTLRNTHAKGVLEWDTHWRRKHAISGGGIAMDHGSHSFYLLFDWLNAFPVSVGAHMETMSTCEAFSETEDFYTAYLKFPQKRAATVLLNWNASVRKVLYTLQCERGALRVEDDHLEIARMKKTSEIDIGKGAVQWDFERVEFASDWMDASHFKWFGALFQEFQHALQAQSFFGKTARASLKCIEVIEMSYRSAQAGGRELSLSS